LRSIERSLNQFNQAGIRPVAISVDTSEESRNLAQKQGYTFPIISDRNADVIRRYDLAHKGAGIHGEDIARPAEFLIDATRTAVWINLTENYWIRARPEQVFEVANRLNK
jgi:peroxiredoxin